jgi:putative glycosyltransferase (TIGR04372 family)
MNAQSLKSRLRNGLFFWESRVAPWIATYFGWVYWPLYKLLKHFNVCFVVNIAGGTGHIICELDLFLRRLKEGELDRKKRYVWIRKSDHFSSACVQLYGRYFWYAKASYLLYELTLPLTIRYKEITQDSGLSGLQWQFDVKGQWIRPIHGQNYLNLLPLPELNLLWNHYFRLKTATPEFFPLITKELHWENLEPLVGAQSKKRVLIHLKEKIANCTAAITDPKTYLDTLQYFYSQNIQLVFVGREKMPSCFLDFSVINYSQSPYASFKNDIALFQSCHSALIGGSGIAYLADCYRKPYLYVNSWHIPTPVHSPLAVVVPTLLQKKTGEYLTFQEQIDLFLTTESDGTVRDLKTFVPRNASSDEILSAAQELEALIQHPKLRSPLQESVHLLGKDLPLFFAASRFGETFLKKHQHLIKVV